MSPLGRVQNWSALDGSEVLIQISPEVAISVGEVPRCFVARYVEHGRSYGRHGVGS